jgi:hypothetical protein
VAFPTSEHGMRFARVVFFAAGVYGILILAPQYFLEARIGRDYPPAITHPEHFYGFICVALAWQVLFLIIAWEPTRYRLAMLAGALEKFGFGGAVGVLFIQGRVPFTNLGFALLDVLLGLLFVMAFRRTPAS